MVVTMSSTMPLGTNFPFPPNILCIYLVFYSFFTVSFLTKYVFIKNTVTSLFLVLVIFENKARTCQENNMARPIGEAIVHFWTAHRHWHTQWQGVGAILDLACSADLNLQQNMALPCMVLCQWAQQYKTNIVSVS